MKKNNKIDLPAINIGYFLLFGFLLFFLGFCSGHAIADPIKALMDFHKPEPVIVQKPKVHIPPAPSPQVVQKASPPYIEQSQISAISSVSESVGDIAKHPLWIGHTLESLQSLRIMKFKEDHYLAMSFQFYSYQFEKLDFIEGYLSNIKILDPKLEGGVFIKMPGINDYSPYVSISASFQFKEHGLGIKTFVVNKDFDNLLSETNGHLFAYYFYSFKSVVFDHDVWSFFMGWASPPLKINLSNIEGFKAQFKGLKQHENNVIAGLHFYPEAISNLSYSLEAGIQNFSFAMNYNIH